MKSRGVSALLLFIALGFLLWWLMPNEQTVPSEAVSSRSQSSRSSALEDQKSSDLVQLGKNDKQDLIRIFGKVLATDMGAEDALVFLSAPGSIRRTPDWETRTDENGNFSFRFHKVKTGPYSLYAQKNGFISFLTRSEWDRVVVSEDDKEIGPVLLHLRPAVRLTVAVTASESGAALGDARVRPMIDGMSSVSVDRNGLARLDLGHEIWSIAVSAPGRQRHVATVDLSSGNPMRLEAVLEPAGSISGRVTNQKGQPLEGAFVEYHGSPSARSDRNGSYFLEHVPLTPVRVTWRHKNYEVHQQQVILSPQQPESVIDVSLRPRSEQETRELTLRGIVYGEAKQELSGASVTLQHSGSRKTTTSTETDRLGRFEIKGRVPNRGNAFLYVRSSGYIPGMVRIPAAQNVAELEIQLERGHSLNGKVIDEDGVPVEGVTVMVIHTLTEGWKTTSDENGLFRLDSLPGQFDLELDREGYSKAYVAAPALDQDPLEIVLWGPGYLSGHVIDQDTDMPITEFTVRVLPEENVLWEGIQEQWMQGGIRFSDPEGRFRIGPLTAETRVALDITAPDFTPRLLRGQQVFSRSKSNTLEIQLTGEGVRVTGRVLDPGGHAIAGCRVSLLRYYKNRRGFLWDRFMTDKTHAHFALIEETTDSEGSFTFPVQPEQWPLDLVVMGPGLANLRKAGLEHMSRAELSDLTMVAQPEAVVYGHIDPEIFENVYAISMMSMGYWTRTEPDGNNNYRFENLPAGTWRLDLLMSSGESYRTISRNKLPLEPGDSLEINFDDEEHYKVSGNVFINDRPMAGGMVLLFLKNSGFDLGQTVAVDGAGRFVFENVEQGLYELLAFEHTDPNLSYEGRQGNPNRETIEVNGDYEGTFHFRKLGNLTGRIRPTPTRPWELMVRGIPDSGDANIYRTTHPDPDGSFRFGSLPPGVYTLSFIISQFDHNSTNPLMEGIIMPGDGSDVDLGDLDLEDRGSLEIILLEHEPRERFVNFFLYEDATGATEAIIGSGRLRPGQTRMVMENLPIGSIWCRAELSGPWVTDPAMVRVEIVPERVAQQTFTLSPTTSMSFYTSEDTPFAALTLENDGAVLALERFDIMTRLQGGGSEPILWFSGSKALIRHIPPGQWLLRARDTRGVEVSRELVLEAGKDEALNLTFPDP